MLRYLKTRSDFHKDALKLVVGTGVAQAITFLLSPVIYRLYPPEEMGIFAFFISIIGGFSLIGTLRYELAVMLPAKDREAADMALISLIVAGVISLLLAMILAFTGLFRMPGVIGSTIFGHWKYILPVMVFLICAGNIFQNWFNRKREYRTLAASKIINSLGNNMVTLLLGFAGFGAWGLVAGNFAGLALLNVFFVAGLIIRHKDAVRNANTSQGKTLIRRYKDLPLSNTPQMLVELVQLYGVIYLLQAFYSPETVGLYSLSQRLLQAPLWLIGTSLGQVFYKDASEKHQSDGNIREIVLKTIRIAFMVALPILLVLLFAGPWLIGLIFGKVWTEAGQIARILAPMMFFDFIRYTIAQTPLIIGKTKQMFHISIAGVLLMVLSISTGGLLFHDSHTGFLLYAILLSGYSVGVILWIVSSVKKMNLL